MTDQLATEHDWLRALEDGFRQRKIRVHKRRPEEDRGYIYEIDRSGNDLCTIWIPTSAIEAGGYGHLAVLDEVERALQARHQ